MAANVAILARRMLADYDVRAPGRCMAEPCDMSPLAAYAIQAEIARLRELRGEAVIGYKVGCTSKVIQAQLGVNEPIYARIFGSECHQSGVRLCASNYANLAVEGELAVRLTRDLSGLTDFEDAGWEIIDELFPVIELHHYVVPEEWQRRQWLIASGGMHAGFVRLSTKTGLSPADFRARSLNISINDCVAGQVDDAQSLSAPLHSLRWLARRLARSHTALRPGQVILTGSPMPLFPVAAGSRIVVEAPPLGACHALVDP